MKTKLFVGALPFVYSNQDLQALFAGVGKVLSAVMVPDPDWGRTRGFGFVEMSTPEEALAAIEKLNGQPVGEKKIFVTEAREQKPGAAKKGEGKIPGRPVHRKVGRGQPSSQPPAASRPSPGEPSAAPSVFPGRFDRLRQREPRSKGAPRTYSPFGSHDRPDTRPPGGPPRSGFSRPAKWEPRGDGKRSFGSPERPRGNFASGNRAPDPRTGMDRPARPYPGRASARPAWPPKAGEARGPASRPGAGLTGSPYPRRASARPYPKPFGKPSGRSHESGRPPQGTAPNTSQGAGPRRTSAAPSSSPKKEFWRKFEKKKP